MDRYYPDLLPFDNDNFDKPLKLISKSIKTGLMEKQAIECQIYRPLMVDDPEWGFKDNDEIYWDVYGISANKRIPVLENDIHAGIEIYYARTSGYVYP